MPNTLQRSEDKSVSPAGWRWVTQTAIYRLWKRHVLCPCGAEFQMRRRHYSEGSGFRKPVYTIECPNCKTVLNLTSRSEPRNLMAEEITAACEARA